MFLHVIAAEYFKEYKIKVTFNDERTGIIDLQDSLKGKVFSPLLDVHFFSQFILDKELDTLVWPNGADFAPEFLYFKAFAHIAELQSQFTAWGYAA